MSHLQFMITPTRVSKSMTCGRQVIFSDKFPMSGGSSLPLTNGSAMHEFYRQLAEISKNSWQDPSMSIDEHIINDTNYVCQDVLAQIKVQNPEFYMDIQRNIPLYKAWGLTWLFERKNNLESLMDDGTSLTEAIYTALPLTEVDLKSYEFGLYGRADQVYLTNTGVKVVDLKTDERITSFLGEQGHKMQLLCYSVMASETYNLPCDEVSLLYVKNQEEKIITVTEELISELRDAIGNYKEIMSSPELPPLLTGLEAELRCPRCPWKKSCYRQAELNGEI